MQNQTTAIIQVYPLWQRGQLLLDCGLMPIDCNSPYMGTLRLAWLIPVTCAGGRDFDLSFTIPDAAIQNVLQGVWIQTPDGEGIVLNVETITEIITACDGCCDNSPVVPPLYPSTYIQETPTQLVGQPYCFTRDDRGTYQDYKKALMDYYGQYEIGTFERTARNGSQSTYCFKAFHAPAYLNGDVNSGGGTFVSSNEAPVLNSNQLYTFTYINGGLTVGTISAQDLQQLLLQLQTTMPFSGEGTWSLQDGRIFLLGSAASPVLIIGTTNVASSNIFLSNDAPANTAPGLYKLSVTANGTIVLPPIYGTTINSIAADTANFIELAQAGTFYIEGVNKIALAAAPPVTSAALVITSNNAPAGRIFASHPVEPLGMGMAYELTAQVDVSTLAPVYAHSLPVLLTNIQATPAYTAIGTWSIAGQTIQVIIPAFPPHAVYIDIEQAVQPILPIISNAAPAVPVGQHLSATIVLEGITQYPELSAATPAALVALLTITAPYSGYGTWSVVQTNKIQLETNQFSSGIIAVGDSNVFVSNPAPTLAAGQIYQLAVHYNGLWAIPAVVGNTLANLLANIPTTGEYATIGGVWSSTATQIELTGSTQTDVYLILTAITEPVFISNAAPAVPVGQRLTFTAILNNILEYPMVGVGNAAAASTLSIATIPPYSTYGTWTYPDGNKVQLETSMFASGTLSLTAKDFFLSNVAPTLAAGDVYQLRFNVNGTFSTVDLIGATLAELITNLPPTVDPTTWGTLVVQVEQIRTTNPLPGIILPAYISLETMTSPVFVSNTIGAIGSQHANVRVEIGTVPVYPIMSAASTGDLVTRLNAYAPFSGMGTWSTSGSNAIQLATTKYNPMTLVLAVTNVFYSNPAPTLTAGQLFRLRGYWDTAFITPDVVGTTLASLAAKIAGSAAWAAFGGTWSVGGTGNDQIINTGSTNKTLYLYLDAVTAPVFLSNVAPVVPANQHLSQTVTIGTEIVYPILSAGDLPFLRTRTAGIAPYSSMGTWAVTGTNEMQLSGAGYDPITLVLTASNEFISNPSPSLTSAQTYQLDVYLNTAFITPPVLGDTLAIVIASIPTTGGYAGIGGTWSIGGAGTNQILLTGSTQTGIYLVLSAITRPPFDIDSNPAPTLTAGDQYVLTADLDFVTLTPPITGLTVAELASNAQANATYAAEGTWSVNTDKVHLASSTITSGQLTITTEVIPPELMASKTEGSAGKSKASDKQSPKNVINKLFGKDKKK